MDAIRAQIFAAVTCMALGTAPLAAAPAPAPAKPATPLKEIGRVHAQTQFCKAVYDHGGLATSAALSNDAALDDTANYLGTVELDDNKLAKPKAIENLQARYNDLMQRAHSAIEETKVLRTVAAQAPTAEQKAALIAYADALGGAMHRQELIGEYYRRFAMYLEVHDQVAWQDQNESLFYAARLPMQPWEHSADPRDRVAPTLTDVSRSESVQVSTRHARVTEDEVVAANSANAAFGPCAAGGQR